MKQAILFITTLVCLSLTAVAQTPDKKLVAAVLKNNVPAAETLLAAGANPNALVEVVPGMPTTYLITAVTDGSPDLVKLLLKYKAQVNQPDGFKSTALMTAAGKGDKALVELLLANGADVKAKDDEGKDALALAKEGGHQAVATLLEQRLK